jgi:hypothetical protein
MALDNYDQPNILFLQGCFLEDCSTIEDMFLEMVLQVSGTSDEQNSVYDKLPDRFTDLESWPTETNTLCWECSCTYYTPPIPIPISIHPSKSDPGGFGHIKTKGGNCTWNCAASGIYREFPIASDRWERMVLLKMLYKKMTGTSIDIIARSPDKTTMVQYGGDKTIENYRKDMITTNLMNKDAIKHNTTKNIQVTV